MIEILTAERVEELRQRVLQGGAPYLDREFPGWELKLPEKFDVRSPCECPLYHIVSGKWEDRNRFAKTVRRLGINPVSLGFDVEPEGIEDERQEEYNVLNEAFREARQDRLDRRQTLSSKKVLIDGELFDV